MKILAKTFDFFRSKLLALMLMLAILVTIVVATTIMPVPVAQRMVFKAIWFNGLLVVLVINTACCFFSRIHRRGWTLVSTGMIIFHLSFVALFVGVIANNLFYYKGSLRLTEGETMALEDPNAYDVEEWGPFFKHNWMRGKMTFHKHLVGFMVDNKQKGICHVISVVDGTRQVKDVIYPTHHMEFNRFKFYSGSDGFAPLFVLYDRSGKEIYGAYTALQSFKQNDGSYLYTTGTKFEGPGSADFPQIPGMAPLLRVQFTYNLPKWSKDLQTVTFRVWEYDKDKKNYQGGLLYEGTAAIGEKVSFGDFALSMKEIRYWASTDVMYNPGQSIVLGSLLAGLGGLSLSMFGRLIRQRA
jgi:hypothetical protein